MTGQRGDSSVEPWSVRVLLGTFKVLSMDASNILSGHAWKTRQAREAQAQGGRRPGIVWRTDEVWKMFRSQSEGGVMLKNTWALKLFDAKG